jgi:heme o synthase
MKLRLYYRLTKPGIVYGNSITGLAGFLLAAQGQIEPLRLLALLAGLAFVIASACVFNNYLDRGIDAKMKRTKRRALVEGSISPFAALVFGTVLALAGLGLLVAFTTLLAAWLAAACWLAYVALYGWAKRKTVHGTVVGSISGAGPPVIGYTAVTGQLDLAALLLFIILTAWQMPHFYAIAIFRLKDYQAASIPVLPAVHGLRATKIQMTAYIVAFIIAATLLTLLGYTGYTYLAAMTVIGLLWLRRAVAGFHTTDDSRWARRLFGFSLIVLLVFSSMISLDVYLP